MRTTDQIIEFLPQLDHVVADELEDQDLDFKARETTLAAELCQRPEAAMRNTLSRIERDLGWMQCGGTGRGTYWTLSLPLTRKLRMEPVSRNQARIDWETAKTRVMSILKQRSKDHEPGLSNADLRTITAFNRDQINPLMRELRQQHPEIQLIGEKNGSRYHYEESA